MIGNATLNERLLAAVNGELGWNASLDADGDISFASEMGFKIWLSANPGDPECVHLFTVFGLRRFLEIVGSSLDLERPDSR